MTGRVVVLTGATSGLGLAAARQLAVCGATIVLVGRSADKNESVVAAQRLDQVGGLHCSNQCGEAAIGNNNVKNRARLRSARLQQIELKSAKIGSHTREFADALV